MVQSLMSKTLQPVQVDEDTVIYVEAIDDVEAPSVVEDSEEQTRTGQKGWMDGPSTQVAQSFKAIENTIKVYTRHTLNAFRDVALTEVQKVTLEFGVSLSGEGGVPYIATSTVECNVKITVECAFPQRKPQALSQPTVQHQSSPNGLPPMPRQPH
jgi:hypothetical protein